MHDDSTFCLSTLGDNLHVNKFSRYNFNNRALSQCWGKNLTLNSQSVRPVFSQYNDDEQDDEQDLEIIDVSNFMTARDDELNNIKRQKSLIVEHCTLSKEKLLTSPNLMPDSLFMETGAISLNQNAHIEESYDRSMMFSPSKTIPEASPIKNMSIKTAVQAKRVKT